MGAQEVTDSMYKDGYACPIADMLMGETAERLAEIHSISREEQDAFALRSQQRAALAQREGRFDSQIVAVEVGRGKSAAVVEKDEHPRADSTMEGLRKLAPVFKKEGGTVTAGNSSGITDGAAAVLVCSESALKALVGSLPLSLVLVKTVRMRDLSFISSSRARSSLLAGSMSRNTQGTFARIRRSFGWRVY